MDEGVLPRRHEDVLPRHEVHARHGPVVRLPRAQELPGLHEPGVDRPRLASRDDVGPAGVRAQARHPLRDVARVGRRLLPPLPHQNRRLGGVRDDEVPVPDESDAGGGGLGVPEDLGRRGARRRVVDRELGGGGLGLGLGGVGGGGARATILVGGVGLAPIAPPQDDLVVVVAAIRYGAAVVQAVADRGVVVGRGPHHIVVVWLPWSALVCLKLQVFGFDGRR